jgi:nucleotide-binding universal stress UspA family protein
VTVRPVQSLLCPIDLERPTLDALRYAFFLAEAFYASLEVTGALAPLPDVPVGLGARREDGGPATHSLNERIARGRLETLLRGVTTAVPGRASPHIVEGELLPGVLQCARRFQSDLIVVGSHAEARTDWVFGASLGEQIACVAACPAISVHEGAQPQSMRVKHILVPVDPRSEVLSFEWTMLFARCFDATVELLYVPSASVLGGEPQHAETRDREQVKLDDLREKLRTSGVRVEDKRDGEGTAFERILQRTESGACDLVVMVAEPRGKKASVTEPSLTAGVRRYVSIPVLSVPPPGSHLTIVPRGSERELNLSQSGADWGERARPA